MIRFDKATILVEVERNEGRSLHKVPQPVRMLEGIALIIPPRNGAERTIVTSAHIQPQIRP